MMRDNQNLNNSIFLWDDRTYRRNNYWLNIFTATGFQIIIDFKNVVIH